MVCYGTSASPSWNLWPSLWSWWCSGPGCCTMMPTTSPLSNRQSPCCWRSCQSPLYHLQNSWWCWCCVWLNNHGCTGSRAGGSGRSLGGHRYWGCGCWRCNFQSSPHVVCRSESSRPPSRVSQIPEFVDQSEGKYGVKCRAEINEQQTCKALLPMSRWEKVEWITCDLASSVLLLGR